MTGAGGSPCWETKAADRRPMLQFLSRYLISLVVLVAAYGAYALLVVPFIEPAVRFGETSASGADPQHEPGDHQSRRDAFLAQLFPAGSWQLQKPKVLETEYGMLLFRDITPADGGYLEIKPCSIVYQRPDTEKKDRPLIVDAPGGATMKFDGEVDFSRGRIGSFVGGRLPGRIQIFGPASSPQEKDAVNIITSNVQINPQQIWTTEAVQFQFGPHHGSGHDMVLRLDARPDPLGGNAPKVAVRDVLSFELVHVDRMHFESEERVSLGLNLAGAGRPVENKSTVDIHCQGPLRFDFKTHIASFEQDVHLVGNRAGGPADELRCQWLGVYFASSEPADKAAKVPNAQRLQGLKIAKLVAVGYPATVAAPREGVTAQCEQFEFVVATEDLTALGPGWFSRRDPDGTTVTARWQKDFRWQLEDEQRVLSLREGAVVQIPQEGEFSGDLLRVWLHPVGPDAEGKKAKLPFAPDRLLAEGNVAIHSRQLTGQTSRLEVNFVNRAGPATPPSATSTPLSSLLPAAGEQARDRFGFRGRVTNVTLLRDGESATLDSVSIEHGAAFWQEPPAGSNLRPLDVSGESITVTAAASPNTALVIRGPPARVAAEGLELEGRQIQLNRQANRAWITGPGKMTLRDWKRPQRMPDAAANDSGGLSGPMSISWEGGMDFDGRTARFQENITARGKRAMDQQTEAEFVATSQSLHATLDRAVDFSNPKPPEKIGLRQLELQQSVYFENRSFKQNAQESYDQGQLKSLKLDYFTGDFVAGGPGWISTTHLSRSLLKQEAGAAPPRGSSLSFGQVNFQQQAVGNLHQREVRFDRRVRGVYGPVASWNSRLDVEPNAPARDGEYYISADQLWVGDMGLKAGDELQIEAQALGNAIVEGNLNGETFLARGYRVSYVTAKELLVLEGDGRSDAQLWRQGANTPDAVARRILYRHRDKYVELDGWRTIDFSELLQQQQLRRQQQRP